MMTKLGPFQILAEVGRGGMGTVYRGLDPVIGRPVAVKVIRLLGYKDSDEQLWMRGRLFREARAAGQLCHPGIVTIYQVGEDEDLAYIAMEFVDGPTLKHLLESDPDADKERLCRILVEAAAALDYAHDRGLVHRDIKPENIMVTAAGVTKVTDFGIAKTMLGQTATRTGAMAGTPLYMSPEQIRGKPLDGRSDQFALAVIAYRIFTGRVPFEAEQVTSVCYQIIHEEPASPEDLAPGIGPQITAVLKRGLSKERENRFETCTEFATALLTAFQMRASKQTEAKPSRFVIPPRVAPAAGMAVAWLATVLIATILFGAAALTRSSGDGKESAPGSSPRLHLAGSTTSVKVEGAVSRTQIKGVLVWTGSARQGDLITISGSRSSTGSVTGALPGRPVRIKVYPAAQTTHGLTVYTSDSSDAVESGIITPNGRAALIFDPRHATELTVFEPPGPLNGWERLLIHANATLSAFVVEWYYDVSA